ncbi:hypothetical protein BC831DRAFT_449456 [Entophlyctis helioformis]|nr:hypothetical protein BC831DRAFT_449456 [Entophlyctis helioformis]
MTRSATHCATTPPSADAQTPLRRCTRRGKRGKRGKRFSLGQLFSKQRPKPSASASAPPSSSFPVPQQQSQQPPPAMTTRPDQVPHYDFLDTPPAQSASPLAQSLLMNRRSTLRRRASLSSVYSIVFTDSSASPYYVMNGSGRLDRLASVDCDADTVIDSSGSSTSGSMESKSVLRRSSHGSSSTVVDRTVADVFVDVIENDWEPPTVTGSSFSSSMFATIDRRHRPASGMSADGFEHAFAAEQRQSVPTTPGLATIKLDDILVQVNDFQSDPLYAPTIPRRRGGPRPESVPAPPVPAIPQQFETTEAQQTPIPAPHGEQASQSPSPSQRSSQAVQVAPAAQRIRTVGRVVSMLVASTNRKSRHQRSLSLDSAATAMAPIQVAFLVPQHETRPVSVAAASVASAASAASGGMQHPAIAEDQQTAASPACSTVAPSPASLPPLDMAHGDELTDDDEDADLQDAVDDASKPDSISKLSVATAKDGYDSDADMPFTPKAKSRRAAGFFSLVTVPPNQPLPNKPLVMVSAPIAHVHPPIGVPSMYPGSTLTSPAVTPTPSQMHHHSILPSPMAPQVPMSPMYPSGALPLHMMPVHPTMGMGGMPMHMMSMQRPGSPMHLQMSMPRPGSPMLMMPMRPGSPMLMQRTAGVAPIVTKGMPPMVPSSAASSPWIMASPAYTMQTAMPMAMHGPNSYPYHDLATGDFSSSTSSIMLSASSSEMHLPLPAPDESSIPIIPEISYQDALLVVHQEVNGDESQPSAANGIEESRFSFTSSSDGTSEGPSTPSMAPASPGPFSSKSLRRKLFTNLFKRSD